MAHYRLHVKPGPKGKGAEHAQYIERGGRFKAEKYGEIGEHERGNLPAWAKGSAARFFAAADDHERANGNSYREFELALPVELSEVERGALVREFVKEQIGERHAYAWAIHEPHGHNPHVHVMFSERIVDGIERGPERYFKRANRQNPERGGHLKSDWFAGSGGPEAVEALRARWAELQNQALERAGVAARVDHRSLKDQGIEREAGQHRGPAISGIEARGEEAHVSVRREAERVDRAQAREALVAEVRVVTRQEMALERVAVRERRELAQEVTGPARALVLPRVEADRREQLGRAQAAAERRVERRQGLGIGKLREKLLTQARALRERIGQQLGRVKAWVAERFPEPLQQIKARARELFGKGLEPTPADLAALKARGRGEAVRPDPMQPSVPRPEAKIPDESPTRAPRPEAEQQREQLASMSSRELWQLYHDRNPSSVSRLVDQDPTVGGAQQAVAGHQRTAAHALEASSKAAQESQRWRQTHGVQAKLHDLGVKPAAYLLERDAAWGEAKRVRVAAREAVKPAMERYDLVRNEATQRITEETAPARAHAAELLQLARQAGEREDLVKEFEKLAHARAGGRKGYQDHSADWRATPVKLRQMIDVYNRAAPQEKEEIRKQLSRTSVHAQSLKEVLKQRRELGLDGPGLSL